VLALLLNVLWILFGGLWMAVGWAIEAALRQTIARTQATNCHIPQRRTLPRRIMQLSQILWKAARMVRRRSLEILGKT
jgi:hypothetical protein